MLLHRLPLTQHPHKEGLLSIAKNPGGTWKPGQYWPFFMPRPEVWILADQDGWIIEAVHCIYCWQPRLLWVWPHAFWSVQCASHISEVNAKLPQGAEYNILPHLPWWHNCFLTFITCMSSLTDLESTIWNWSHQSATFSEMKSPT